MEYPVIVNILIPTKEGKHNIVGGVVDFHYSGIKEILNGSTPDTTAILYKDGRVNIIVMKFEEAVELYMQTQKIVGNYREDVFNYLKDNWSHFRENNSNNDLDEILP